MVVTKSEYLMNDDSPSRAELINDTVIEVLQEMRVNVTAGPQKMQALSDALLALTAAEQWLYDLSERDDAAFEGDCE